MLATRLIGILGHIVSIINHGKLAVILQYLLGLYAWLDQFMAGRDATISNVFNRHDCAMSHISKVSLQHIHMYYYERLVLDFEMFVEK